MGIIRPKENKVIRIAREEREYLAKFCKRIMVTGSIRRRDPNPRDIDIVLIPASYSDRQFIDLYTADYPKGKLGRGEKIVSYIKEGIEIELFFTNAKHWGAMLLFTTGPPGYGIGLRCVAQRQQKFLNRYGLYAFRSKLIASRTEESIYRGLHKEWKAPVMRGVK